MKEELKRIVEEGQSLSERKIRLEKVFKEVVEKINIELAKIPAAKKGVLSYIKGWSKTWQETCLHSSSTNVIKKFDMELLGTLHHFYEEIREENIENQEGVDTIESILKKLEN